MMNKGLEVIEAHWLFGAPREAIEVVIHPQSVIHSLVEYVDGSVLAQLGHPDMRTPIAQALAYPERVDAGVAELDLARARRADVRGARPRALSVPRARVRRAATRAARRRPCSTRRTRSRSRHSSAGRVRFTDIAAACAETLARVRRAPVAHARRCAARPTREARRAACAMLARPRGRIARYS